MAPNQRHFSFDVVLRLASQPMLPSALSAAGLPWYRRWPAWRSETSSLVRRMQPDETWVQVCEVTQGRHSWMRRKAQTRNLESPGSMLRIAPE
jgi:hypothetical protein